MKNQVREILEECLSEASVEELEILKDVLLGFQKKQLNINSSYIGGLLHMERTISDETCELTVPLTPFFHNSLGIVHGGITATIIDTAMGTLANSLLPDSYNAVTTQINIHYLAVGNGDYMKCKARLEHKGSKTMVISADVHRSDGKKIAHASGSFFIIKKKDN